ncbi:MAG: CHASE2 domain-containing protein [Anaerolineae bacterium]|nr:CHASE2 domain-containing protein [Anaerolineae bacterium]
MDTHSLIHSDKLTAGYLLGAYTLLEQIGVGGQANIWSAWDRERERVVAVRAIPLSVGATDSVAYQMLQKEAHLVASLSHPNILPLYEFGRTKQHYLFVLRYVSRGSIADLLINGPMFPKDVLRFTSQIVAALNYIHTHGIVHRDLKPSNVLLDTLWRVYISDFGLARLLPDITAALHTGHGTAPYSPPEQHLKQQITPQSDIYSLGVMLFEMLTGNLPWDGDTSLALMQIDSDVELPDIREFNPDLPDRVTNALHKLTAYKAADRPATALEALDIIRRAIGDTQSLMPEPVPILTGPAQDIQEAGVLLKHHVVNTEPGDPLSIRLTHFVLIDSVYQHANRLNLTLTTSESAFILQAALLHDYHFDTWWHRLADEPEARIRVVRQVMEDGIDIVIERLLSLLAVDTGVKKDWFTQPGLERLVDFCVNHNSLKVRGDALSVLEQIFPQQEDWQPIAISVKADRELAGLALTDDSLSRRVARLLGRLGTETAFKYIMEREQHDRHFWSAALEIRDGIGRWPESVAPRFRLQGWLQRLWQTALMVRVLRTWVRLLIGLIVGVAVALLVNWRVLYTQDLFLRDALFAPYDVSGITTLVAIDDDSLSEYGRWENWPRSLHAELIRQLEAAGAKVIAFDVTFATATEDDTELAEAMAEHGAVLQPVLGEGDALYRTLGIIDFENAVQPQAVLRESSAALGHTNILHDPDGTIRTMPSLIHVDDGRYLSLPLAAISLYLTGDVTVPTNSLDQSLDMAGRSIPVGTWGEMRINFAGPPASQSEQTFNMVSYRDVLSGDFDPALFKGKIALVGVMATAEPDKYLTPVSDAGRPMFGVEVLANAIETVWSQRFIRLPAFWVQVLILVGLGAITALVLNARPWLGLLLAVGEILLYFVLAMLLFDAWGILLSLLYPVLVISLVFILVTIYHLSVEIRERREFLSMFENRVQPRVARATLQALQDGEISLEGQVQEVTVLVASVRNFAEFGERHLPDKALEAVNDILAKISGMIVNAEGMVVQADGDHLTAVFNAPLAQPTHPSLALKAMLEVSRSLDRYRKSLPPADIHRDITLSYGIYTGRAVVSYSRSAQRSDVTVFGDAVEIASQLSLLADSGQMLAGRVTVERSGEVIAAEPVDPLALPGKVAPIDVYRLLPATEPL